MPETSTDNAVIAALDQRVTGLEQGIKDVVTAVSILSNEIRSSTKTQWPVIWSAVGVGISVLTVIGGLLIWPMREAQMDLRQAIREVDKDQVPRVEHERIWGFQQRISDLNAKLNESRVDMILKRLDKIDDDFYRRKLNQP